MSSATWGFLRTEEEKDTVTIRGRLVKRMDKFEKLIDLVTPFSEPGRPLVKKAAAEIAEIITHG